MRSPRKNELDMIHGPLAGKIVLFALPLAASSVLQQLFNAADIAVVGRFASAEAMAAVGSNASVISLLVITIKIKTISVISFSIVSALVISLLIISFSIKTVFVAKWEAGIISVFIESPSINPVKIEAVVIESIFIKSILVKTVFIIDLLLNYIFAIMYKIC